MDGALQPATLQRAFVRARSNNRNRIAGNIGWSVIAPAQSACQPGSRWSRFAFTSDDEASIFSVEENDGGGFNLYVGGLLRTQTDTFDLNAMDLINPNPAIICWVADKTDGIIVLGTPELCQRASNTNGLNVNGPVTITNPPISLPANYQSEELITFGASEVSLVEMEHEPGFFILEDMLAVCVAPIVPGVSTILNHAGEYYKHNPRVQMLENSLESPSTSLPPQTKDPFFSPRFRGSDLEYHRGTCPAAAKTFLNKHTCTRRPECTTMKYSDAWFTLDEEHLQMFWQTSEKLVFSVDGLDIMSPHAHAQSPCGSSYNDDSYSRWLSTPGPCLTDTALNSVTLASITAKLQSGQDCHVVHPTFGFGSAICTEATNPSVRDITLGGAATCNDPAARGASVTVFPVPPPPPPPPPPAPTDGGSAMVAGGSGIGDPSHWMYLESSCEAADALHEVNCCSDDPLPGYQQRNGCAVWAEAMFLSVGGGGTGCVHAVNLATAMATCAGDGSRLCTLSELEGGCCQGTGCGHSADHIWTGDACFEPAPPYEWPAEAGTCWTHTHRHNLGVFDFTYAETSGSDNIHRLNGFQPTYFRTKAQAGDMVYDLNEIHENNLDPERCE